MCFKINKHIGQIVIGYPGSGKTSYCYASYKFLFSNLKNPILINLDPGNDSKIFLFEINICKMISSTEISTELHLGPNGSIFYAMEYFEQNFDWFEKKLAKFLTTPLEFNFLFDFPGQIELYTHHSTMRNLIKRIKINQINLATVALIDSIYWKDPETLFFFYLISILTMLNIELPFVNILSKIDLIISTEQKNICNIMQIHNKEIQQFYISKSIFCWANLFYNFVNEILIEFSPSSLFPINIFEKKFIKKIFSKIKKLLIF
jgi:GTPase SAR1 family protein